MSERTVKIRVALHRRDEESLGEVLAEREFDVPVDFFTAEGSIITHSTEADVENPVGVAVRFMGVSESGGE